MNILGSKWVTIENETDMFSPLCLMQDILLLIRNRRLVPDINNNYIQNDKLL